MQETTQLSTVDAKLHSAIHVICPDRLRRVLIEQGKDSPTQVGLASSLSRASDSDDSCPWAVPRQKLSRAEEIAVSSDQGECGLRA